MKAAHVPTNHSAGGTFHYAKDGNTLENHEPCTALTDQQLAARAKRAPQAAAKKAAAKKVTPKKARAKKAAPKPDAAPAPAAAASQE